MVYTSLGLTTCQFSHTHNYTKLVYTWNK